MHLFAFVFWRAVELVRWCVQRVFSLPVLHSQLGRYVWGTSWRHQTPSPSPRSQIPITDLKHTHTQYLSVVSQWLISYSVTYRCQCLLFQEAKKKYEYQPTVWMETLDVQKLFFCSLTPPMLHLTVKFPPTYSLLFKSTTGGKKKKKKERKQHPVFHRGETERDSGTWERNREGEGSGEEGGGEVGVNWPYARNSIQWPIFKPEREKESERVRERQGGRIWIARFVLFTNRNPKEQTAVKELNSVWMCGHL